MLEYHKTLPRGQSFPGAPLVVMQSSMSVMVLALAFLCRVSCETNDLYETSGVTNDGRTVLLGGLFPVHSATEGCEELQDFAVQQVEAMAFAIDCVNDDPTLLPNVTLAFTTRDTCSNPSHALDRAFQFVQSEDGRCAGASGAVAVSGVVGAHYSRVSIDVANLLSLYKVPQISFISTADVLSDKTRFDYFFRTVPPDKLQAEAIADIIVLFNWTYVFAVHSDDSYGNGGIEALIEQLEDSGVCIAAKIPLSVTASALDYDRAVRSMSTDWVANASIAVLFGHLDAAVGMMEALTSFKESSNGSKLKDLTWIGTDAWGDSLPPEYHEIAHGMLSVIPLAIVSEAFDEYFTSLNPSYHTGNVWFNEFWESHFNCSLGATTCDLSDEFTTLNTEEHMQYSQTTLIVDAVMAFAHALQSLIESECPDGDLCDAVSVSRLTGQAISGELLREHLHRISFRGASSNLVTFDAEGNEPGAYFVKNLQRSPGGQYSFENVGTWHHLESLDVWREAIQWVSNGTTAVPQSFCSSVCDGGHQPIPVADQQCCWVCSPCQHEKGVSDGTSECTNCNDSFMPNLPERTKCVPIPATFLEWTDTWAIALITITLCGLVVTVCVIVILGVHYNHRVVKASSREVSAILLLGVLLCYLMPFPLIAMPSEAVCAIRRFGVGFSFSVCYSALLVKTNRIHRLFNQTSMNPSKPPRFTGAVSQVLLTGAFISVQVVAAAAWLAFERPSTTIAYATRTAELRCGESPVIGLSVTLGYSFFLLVLSTYFAFRARKVPENFNEARYINVTLYTLCIVWLAFIPTYFATAKLGAAVQTNFLTISIIMSATTTLAFLFVPRIILLFSQLQEKRKKCVSETNPSMTTVKTAK